MTKPFVKWVGGKSQLLHVLSRRIPATHGRFYEPFIGGGACFLHFAGQARFKEAVINDANQELVNLYVTVRDHPDDLMCALDALCTQENWNTREFHRHIRESAPTEQMDRATRFIYLNKTSFNGLWRVNRAGRFNVPFGRYDNPKLYDRVNILDASCALQSALIRNLDFEAAVSDARAGDVIYFDPPYIEVSATSSFTSYAGKFGPDEQARLAKLCRDMVQRGVYCVVSNSDTSTARDLYGEFEQFTVEARRSVNSDPTKRGKITELLCVGVPPGWSPLG
jgi:DNA adenine methylase